MRIRRANLIRTLALIDAVGDGVEQIVDQHLAAAMALIDWMGKHVRVMLGTWAADPDKFIEEKIITVLRKKGPLGRRDLWHFCRNRKYDAKRWGEVLKALKEVGVVGQDPAGVHYLIKDEPGQ